MRVTGTPRRWSRDLAIIGGSSSLVAPAMAMAFGVPASYVAAAGVAGAATGGALGWLMPALLDKVRGRAPILLLLLLGPLVGLLWGGTVGALAAPLAWEVWPLSLAAGAVAGAVQFGLWWFPYTFQTVRGGRTWPVVLAACLVTPLAGIAAIMSVFTVLLGGL